MVELRIPTLRAFIDRKGRMIPKDSRLSESVPAAKERLSVPLDAAMRDANSIAVIAAGNRPYVADRFGYSIGGVAGRSDDAESAVKLPPGGNACRGRGFGTAYVVQTIGRASLWIVCTQIAPRKSFWIQNHCHSRSADWALYASSQSLGMACASYHPDGQDDGHRWKLNVSGEGNIDGRTMPLQGTLSGRGKFRRTGHCDSLQKLVDSDLNALSAGRKIADSAKLTKLAAVAACTAGPPHLERKEQQRLAKDVPMHSAQAVMASTNPWQNICSLRQ